MAEPAFIPLTASRGEQIFPILSATQIQRLVAHGHARSVPSGDVLVELGDREIPIFVVISGELETVSPSFGQETLIRILGQGQFTGELSTLSGRRAIARIRARQDGDVVEIARDNVLALVQADEELSEILMRAFILRRAELLQQGIGDVTLVGSSYSADMLRIKEFLTRNGHPYTYINLEHDPAIQNFLDHFHSVPLTLMLNSLSKCSSVIFPEGANSATPALAKAFSPSRGRLRKDGRGRSIWQRLPECQ
jgi:thioredoxin reductase (NADPH)